MGKECSVYSELFKKRGARSTITTLWSIPVVTSDALMVDFYDNLWIKKMSRLEALRQAQINMLRTGVKYVANEKQPAGPNVRLPPFFWAGFVLAGDWRRTAVTVEQRLE